MKLRLGETSKFINLSVLKFVFFYKKLSKKLQISIVDEKEMEKERSFPIEMLRIQRNVTNEKGNYNVVCCYSVSVKYS